MFSPKITYACRDFGLLPNGSHKYEGFVVLLEETGATKNTCLNADLLHEWYTFKDPALG